MSFEQFSNGLLEWLIRLAGLFWLIGAFMLFRQIRTEMLLDRMAAKLEHMARDVNTETAPDPIRRWKDRDDAARRGWIAAQAVVLAVTSVSMLMLHRFSAWLAALLVLGQGVYFLWRERTARAAPDPQSATHARPSQSTVNAGWVSLAVAALVWLAAWRGLLH